MLLLLWKQGSERPSDLSKVTQKVVRAPGCSVDDTQGLLGVPPGSILDGKQLTPGGRHLNFSSGLQHLLAHFGQLSQAGNSQTLCFRSCRIAV